jgi:prepilin-type N-terminal cleavage/methylation domain-containing protein
MNRRESGYSLVEILVVVAIIGVISLVTVPNFIAMQHAGKIKNSLRSFMSDVRGMRQRSVTRHRQTKISFATGTAANAREYFLAEFDPATATWGQIGARKQLEEACYFSNQVNLTDLDSDGTIDIVFRPDGTPILPSITTVPEVNLKTDWKVGKPEYKVKLRFSGAVQTCAVGDPGC